MQPIIISDASCLILLDKIEALDLLEKLFGAVVTTNAVAAEFGGILPERVRIQDPQYEKTQLVLETSLDRGKASAIALALEQADCLLIIDELKGRKIAKQLGLHITGTLGLIAEAKTSGHIISVKPLLAKVRQTNFRLSESLEDAILRQAGE